MNVYFCYLCDRYLTRDSVEEPTKGGIMLIGLMQCKIHTKEQFMPVTSADLMTDNINTLRSIDKSLRELCKIMESKSD